MVGFDYISTCLLLAMVSKPTETQAANKRRDAKDFSKEFLYSTRYDFLPPTATVPIYICDYSHRPFDGNVNQFQVYHNDRWWTQSCPENLEWNQGSCRCEYPDGNPANTHCRDYRHNTRGVAGKYEQYVNGEWIVRDCSLAVAGLVWDQSACQCVWGPGTSGKVTGQGITPCDIMLNMTFDAGVKDEAKGSFVEVARGDALHLQPFGRDNTNRAARFQGTTLNIWFFSNNELGSSLRVEFQFKMDDSPEARDKYQILLSNGCNVTVPGYTTPSLAIGYRPSDESYLLAFQTVTNRKAIACSLTLGAYDWHTVSLIYEDGVLFLRIDGHPCIVSQDFAGDIQTTACPLTVGADPLERQSQYRGYMDNIVVGRYCRRYMDIEGDSEEEDQRTFGDNSNRGHGLRRNQNSDASKTHHHSRRTADKSGATSNKKPAISSFRAHIETQNTNTLDAQVAVEPVVTNVQHVKTSFEHGVDTRMVMKSLNDRLKKAQNIYIVNDLSFDGYGDEEVNKMGFLEKGRNMILKNDFFEKQVVDDGVDNDDDDVDDDGMVDDNRINAGGYVDNYYDTDNKGFPVGVRSENDEWSVEMTSTGDKNGHDYSENDRDGHDGDNDGGGRSGSRSGGIGLKEGEHRESSRSQKEDVSASDNDVSGHNGHGDVNWERHLENNNNNNNKGLKMTDDRDGYEGNDWRINEGYGRKNGEKIDYHNDRYYGNDFDGEKDDYRVIDGDKINDNESDDNAVNNDDDRDDYDDERNARTSYGEAGDDVRDGGNGGSWDKNRLRTQGNNKNVDDIGKEKKRITKRIRHPLFRKRNKSKTFHPNMPNERETTERVRKIVWWMRRAGK